MPYLLVLLVAAASGAGVAAYTVRQGRTAAVSPETWTKTYEDTPAAPPPAAGTEDATTPHRRAQALPSAPTWQTRLTGVAGLLIAVLLAAGLIVAGFYSAWLALKRMFGG